MTDRCLYSKRMLIASLAVVFVWCMAAPSMGWGANLFTQKNDDSAFQRLNVGESKIIELKARVTKVELVDPAKADVMVLTPWKLYLTGKDPGATRLILRGKKNLVQSIIVIEVAPNVAQLKSKIHEMFPNENDIRVNAAQDSMTLSGSVSSQEILTQVMALASSYVPAEKEGKSKVVNFLEVGGVQQVMLEVRVSEMSKTLIRRLGVNFNYVTQSGTNFGLSMLNNFTKLPENSWPGNPLTVADKINYITRFMGNDTTWTFLIDALKEDGLVKVLAEPTLITLSGKPANFLAGGEYPIPVPQTTGGGTTITIDYKQFGVGLKFTPTVLSSNRISMQVAPEVSELDFTNAVTIQGYIVPALTTRRVATTVELADGQSFAIAGLLRDGMREDAKKFPVLGEIPIIGALFKSSEYQRDETELVIIVTPHLVKPLDLAKQTLPTDAFIDPSDFDFYLMGSLEGRGDKDPAKAQVKEATLPGQGGLEGDFGFMKPE
jgi:pilus assembly protein CpaC